MKPPLLTQESAFWQIQLLHKQYLQNVDDASEFLDKIHAENELLEHMQ